MKTILACLALLAASPLVLAQSNPAIPSAPDATAGIQRAPGPTPDDPLGGKLIALDPAQSSFVEAFNANLEALYNRPTTYYQVINGYCVAAPMTEREYFWLTRR